MGRETNIMDYEETLRTVISLLKMGNIKFDDPVYKTINGMRTTPVYIVVYAKGPNDTEYPLTITIKSNGCIKLRIHKDIFNYIKTLQGTSPTVDARHDFWLNSIYRIREIREKAWRVEDTENISIESSLYDTTYCLSLFFLMLDFVPRV